MGLTSLLPRELPMPPRMNIERAHFVLDRIDQILGWERDSDHERDTSLGGWALPLRSPGRTVFASGKLKSFDDFLDRRFPGPVGALIIMSIHEHMPKQVKSELKAMDGRKPQSWSR